MERILLALAACFALVQGEASQEKISPEKIPGIQPAPAYMVDNTNNLHGVAPDKGTLRGPIVATNIDTTYLMTHNASWPTSHHVNASHVTPRVSGVLEDRQSGGYWMETITHGQMPLQPGPYTFFRNVQDFGASGNGATDDTAAINAAISAGNRCGLECGSTTIAGALIYFPPGTYMLSTPIIQLYYTQFVGDPNNRPTLKGLPDFKGIALVDTDVYIPGGNGAEWYINQNQFYRQIRNIIFDLTAMNDTNNDGDQTYAATGLHWQVAQATSLQNCDFIMPDPHNGPTNTVGIFMENGSGGFVSDLYFFGGNIAFRAGSQQFTARGLKFQNCGTAISHIWDWGFTWKNIEFNYCYVAIDCQLMGSGPGNQGTGSITLLDSTMINVPYAIPVNPKFLPSIVIDNLNVQNVEFLVYVSGSTNYLLVSGNTLNVKSWAMGKRYTSIEDSGSYQHGFIDPAPNKPAALLDGTGKFYTRSKPQYENLSAGNFIIVTANNVSNDGTGNQADAINSILSKNVGTPVFFPAGIYLVKGTVFVPVNSVLVGEGWSQIMASGSYFEDEKNPQVVVRFGNAGDVGSMEISDFLFTVQGPTAGAVLVEWNVHESSQGSVAMWDCHFRVGGAISTHLQQADCPKLSGGVKSQCKAGSLLLHVTSGASGYFENVWAWTADHDIDEPPSGGNDTSASQIDIYVARGVLIESAGPVWLYGTASEHNAFYQYQFTGARNIYSGHMQTETPYYMPNPDALGVYTPGAFTNDPTFDNCDSNPTCTEAWALRVLHSQDVYIYGAGFYNFFNNYDQTCIGDESCQERIIETSFTEGLWLYDLYTKGATQPISPEGGAMAPVLVTDPNVQYGFTTEISAWLALATDGGEIGDDSGSTGSGSSGGSGIVYVDPSIWNETNPTVYCIPPCVIVLPPRPVATTTTITYPPITTTLIEFSGSDDDNPTTVSTTIILPPVTTTAIDYWNINITTVPVTTVVSSSIQPPPTLITETPNMVTTTFYPPPYPSDTSSATKNNPTVTVSSGKPGPTCKSNCGHHCDIWCGGICILNCIPCLGCNGLKPPPVPGPPGPPPGPGEPPSQSESSSECSTTTTSECLTLCTTSPTSGCSSTCSSIIQCEATPTNGIANLAPTFTAEDEQWILWDGDTAADASVYTAMSSLLNSVLPLLTTTPPPPPPPPPPPTTTTITTTTTVAPPPPPPTGPFSVLVPSGHGIDCHTDVDYTDLSSCYSDGFNGFDKSKTYSNNDNICQGTGEVDDQGTRIGGYCTLAALADCSVVWGIADSDDSAPDVFSGQQLYDFLQSAQKKCGNGPAAVISTTSSDPNDDPGGWDYSFCLVHPGQENACGTNQGIAVP